VELERCLQSLRGLRFPSFEILVVDNASSNSAAEVLAHKYGARYVFDPVPGLSHARNVGARACATDIVAYIDDDAVADPEWLNGLAEEFKDPEVAAVVGRCLPLKMETEAEHAWAQVYGMGWGAEERKILERHTPDWFSLAAFGGVGTGGSMAFRQSAFEVWPGFNERLGRGTPLDGNEEHHAFFSLVRLGFKVVGTPNASVWHPCPPTMEALRSRRLKDNAALGGFFCMMLVEEKGYRLATIRHILRKLLSPQPDRTSGAVRIRVTSRTESLLARLRGPWLYLLSTRKARESGKASGALLPVPVRTMGHERTAPVSISRE
jgi:cellulose synthase/poly-beta-1,6-N-acetylglucosamine synthase-like glycosyltransferase